MNWGLDKRLSSISDLERTNKTPGFIFPLALGSLAHGKGKVIGDYITRLHRDFYI